MTKNDAIVEITSVRRTCRGPLSEAEAAQKNALLAEAAATNDAAIAEAKLAEARALDESGRPGCGYDFNLTIIAGPLDGEQHDYTCPQCGVEGIYTAPLYDLSDA